MAKLHIEPLPELTAEAYFDGIRRSLEATRQAAGRTSVLLLWWRSWGLAKAKRVEWLGDFAKFRSQPIEITTRRVSEVWFPDVLADASG
jgi:hypothetical protein